MAVAHPTTEADEARPFRRGPLRPHRLSPVRERLSGATLARRFRFADTVAVGCAVVADLWMERTGALLTQPLGAVLPLAAGATVALATLAAAGGQRYVARDPLWTILARVATAVLTGAATVWLLARLIPEAAPDHALTWAALTGVGLVLSHAAAWRLVRRWRAQGLLTPNIIVVGATDNAARLIEAALETREINVLGVFDDRLARAPANVHGVPVLGDTTALLDHKVLPYVDRIVITVSTAAQERVRALIDRLRVAPNPITLFIDVEGERERAQTLARLTDAPLAQVSGIREDEARAAAKRLQDLVLGALLLIPALPVMAAVALAVRLDSPGPVLFRQRRQGFNNEQITVFKFRSMRADGDGSGARQVSCGDPRVTRVGRFIRKTSLDELPQLLNVLSGEMSLVGPRPHPVHMMAAGEAPQRLVAEYAWRHRVKPGITGWAQINGSRGPVETPEAVRRRVALDIDYIERQSFWLDLYILAMTLPRLLGDRHAVR